MNDLFIFRLGGILIIVNNRVTRLRNRGTTWWVTWTLLMRKFMMTNLIIFSYLKSLNYKETKKLRNKGILGMSFEYFDMRIQGDFPIYFQVDG